MDPERQARCSCATRTTGATRRKLDKLIFRPIADNAARLQALQTGEIQGYDLVEPQDVPTIEGDSNLQLLDRPAFNVGYVAINQKMKPIDKLEVRQAIAYGLDRQAVVDNFYGGRGEVAKEFMPPAVVGYADDVDRVHYDPAKAKALLQKAGVSMPLKVDFWYPTDVSRPYMPDPKRNFEAFAASLNKSGFKVVPHSGAVEPGLPRPCRRRHRRRLHLIGWTGDYGDADNFIGTFFQQPQKASSGRSRSRTPSWTKLLNDAEIETDAAKREDLYKEANRKIMDCLPGVPYAHSKPALAFTANVKGYVPSPTTNESFAHGLDRGTRTGGGRRATCCASSSAGSCSWSRSSSASRSSSSSGSAPCRAAPRRRCSGNGRRRSRSLRSRSSTA